MEPLGDVIDLDPAVVQAVSHGNDHVSILFDHQPCYSWAVGENPRLVPLYNCELRVWHGRVELMSAKLPFETDDWEVFYPGGSRRCFLPVSFEVSGPIRFVLGPKESPKLVVVGERVTLELGARIGTFEQGLAP